MDGLVSRRDFSLDLGPLSGGIPLLVDGELDGELVGAIGGTAQEDEDCVLVAAGALGFD